MLSVEAVVPTFFVQDVRKSVEWYLRVLGFRVAFDADGYAGVTLGPATIHLAQIERPPPGGLRYKGGCYLRVAAGVDEYIGRIQAAGQPLTAALKDHPEYGMREATVRDPDGNDIYIGQPMAQSDAAT